MGILADHQIERDVKIEPFTKEQQAKGVISYGMSSYGYDVRIGFRFKVFTNTYSTEIDPKNFNDRAFVDIDLTPGLNPEYQHAFNKGGLCRYCGIKDVCAWGQINHCFGRFTKIPNHVLIPPNSFALGESYETITVPRDCLAVCLGKSTYARCGIIVNVTPLEPEWTGKVTIEISNTAPLPSRIYAGEGICQILFLRGDAICTTSYADKKGRYQSQTGLTLPFINK